MGEGGNSSTGSVTYGNGGAGLSGGGRNYGAGGGMSAISYTTLSNPAVLFDADLVAIVGGGGTAAAFTNAGSQPGEGGGTNGQDGVTTDGGGEGQGGTQVAGGASTSGNAGSFLLGGDALTNGGAGGGGYYVGGSGFGAGPSLSDPEGVGGGGSGYVDPAAISSTTTAVTGQTPPNAGVADNATDDNADGWADIFDSNDGGTALADGDQGGTVLPNPNSDGDGLTNYLDLDSDSDGITDNVEGQTTTAFVAPLGTDSDEDGWDDRYDGDVDGGTDGTPILLSNNEAVGEPDYLDDVSDGDGLPDWIQGFDDDNSGDALNDFIDRADNYEAGAGNPLNYVNSDDTDNDGIPNWLEDDNTNNVPNFLDPTSGFYQDTDNDGIVDLYDADNFGVPSITPDFDGDGEYDFRDISDAISQPIDLLTFKAIANLSEVNVYWITETEINNDYFVIERSSDGEDYQAIAKVDGAGNSNQQITYSHLDDAPFIGANHYRLKQVDFDGTYSYSQVEVAMFEGSSTAINIYPNPGNGQQLFIEIEKPSASVYQLDIQDANGKLIQLALFNVEEEVIYFERLLQFNRQLAKGTYYLTFYFNDHRESIKYMFK